MTRVRCLVEMTRVRCSVEMISYCYSATVEDLLLSFRGGRRPTKESFWSQAPDHPCVESKTVTKCIVRPAGEANHNEKPFHRPAPNRDFRHFRCKNMVRVGTVCDTFGHGRFLCDRPCPLYMPHTYLRGRLRGHGLRPEIRPCPKTIQTMPGPLIFKMLRVFV